MKSDCCGSDVIMGICRRCGEHCCEGQDTSGSLIRQFEILFREKWTSHHFKEGNSLDKAHEWRLYLEKNDIHSFLPLHADKGEYCLILYSYFPVKFVWRAVVLGSLP